MVLNDQGIKGPDISFYQGDPADGLFVNFQKMKDYGVFFTIIRAGQHNWKDSAFDYNWNEAKRVGLPRASYFFLDKDGDGKTQARFYWSLIKDDPGEGPLIVDFEWGSGFWPGLYDFLVELTLLSGYPPNRIWIYTGKYYWQDYGPREQAKLLWFLRHPLWLANYSDTLEADEVPYPWIEPIQWQRGTTIVWGPDLGVHSLELDWNTFNGDIEEWKKYWFTDYVPTPHEEEGETMKYRVVWSKGIARRTAPHTGRADEGTYTGLVYAYGAELEVIEDNIPDENDPGNINKKWVKFSDGFFGASEYPTSGGVPAVRMQKIAEPVPVPGDKEIEKGVIYFKDGTTLEMFP